jgi:hypothetical protein
MKSNTSLCQSDPAIAPPPCVPCTSHVAVSVASTSPHRLDGNGHGELGAGAAAPATPLESKPQVVAPHGTTQAAGRPQYEAHIGSAAWKTGAARLGELKASGFRCRTCYASAEEAELQVHHRTYERFGRERQGDLTTLCIDCHVVITDMLRRRRYTNQDPVFFDVMSNDDMAPLFDPVRAGEWS